MWVALVLIPKKHTNLHESKTNPTNKLNSRINYSESGYNPIELAKNARQLNRFKVENFKKHLANLICISIF